MGRDKRNKNDTKEYCVVLGQGDSFESLVGSFLSQCLMEDQHVPGVGRG